jgi:hypothetical protein
VGRVTVSLRRSITAPSVRGCQRSADGVRQLRRCAASARRGTPAPATAPG